MTLSDFILYSLAVIGMATISLPLIKWLFETAFVLVYWWNSKK